MPTAEYDPYVYDKNYMFNLLNLLVDSSRFASDSHSLDGASHTHTHTTIAKHYV